ncbi:MAG: hypothetical protein EBZ75_13495 [Oxalobacteraceae bacterium]|nr:hypothetical protein [Oxalobacteraceae bacterium]
MRYYYPSPHTMRSDLPAPVTVETTARLRRAQRRHRGGGLGMDARHWFALGVFGLNIVAVGFIAYDCYRYVTRR